jgi:hypothetical protein
MGRMMPIDDNAVNKEMTAMSSGVYDPLYEAGEQAYGNTLRRTEGQVLLRAWHRKPEARPDPREARSVSK